MKYLLAAALGFVALGFVTTPNSKAQGIFISIGGGSCYYPQSYGYGDYYGDGCGYTGGGFHPYYGSYSHPTYYSTRQVYYYNSGNPYGYRRSYYRAGNRYARYRTYRNRRHHDWQDND